jgi:phosphopantothenoylcysteine synthetase/decarboxylase
MSFGGHGEPRPDLAAIRARNYANSLPDPGDVLLVAEISGATLRRNREAKRILFGMANVLVGVTGGIAAYKAPAVIRRLREAGHEVETIATEAAFHFISEETLSIATGGHVRTEKTWWEESGRVEHVSLARWADLVLVAPATADAMARVAIGLGDDLLSATILAGAKKVLWAPAMNPEMWENPATKRNVETLGSWGHHFVGPAEGSMASAEEEPGLGRLVEEAEIVAAVERALSTEGR